MQVRVAQGPRALHDRYYMTVTCRFELLKGHAPKALRLRTHCLSTIDDTVLSTLVPWITLSAAGPVVEMVLGCKTLFFAKSKVRSDAFESAVREGGALECTCCFAVEEARRFRQILGCSTRRALLCGGSRAHTSANKCQQALLDRCGTVAQPAGARLGGGAEWAQAQQRSSQPDAQSS